MWGITKKNPNALLLVAHADDETIYCGGTMLHYPKWNWHVVCMTGEREELRGIQFGRAMKYFLFMGVNVGSYNILGLTDIGQQLSEKERADWRSALQSKKLKPDIVFTHNARDRSNQHVAVNEIAHQLYKNVWEFICPVNP